MKKNKKVKQLLHSNKGMTLVEMLVALTLLALIAMTFVPAFSSYYRSIRKAGDIAQDSYRRASRMERVISGSTTDYTYEQSVSSVPITFTTDSAHPTTVSFSGRNEIEVNGSVLTDNYLAPDENTYSTFTAHITGNQMACFPSVISDDFSTKTIYVVIVGREFNNGKNGERHGKLDRWTLSVDKDGTDTVLDSKYYDFTPLCDQDLIMDTNGEYTIARITLKGANDMICFENSPLTIKCNDDVLKVDITAPEIIMVGEGTVDGATSGDPGSTSNRYYYATAGVQYLNGSSEPSLEIIAKPMNRVPLTAAMNDVEWVQPEMGDNGNGAKNKYGYYVMGGDAGQVRRFWQKKDIDTTTTSKNYCWDGDILYNYNRYLWIESDNTAQSGSYETFAPAKTTQAQFKSIFRAGDNINGYTFNGQEKANLYFMGKGGGGLTYNYSAITRNYFTANIDASTASGKAHMTWQAVARAKFKGGFLNTQTKTAEAYGVTIGIDGEETINRNIYAFTSVGGNYSTKMDKSGYKAATSYGAEHPADDSLITITSVGAVQFNQNGNNKYDNKTQQGTITKSEIYPTQPYTLYCGYIPAVIDVWGWKTKGPFGYSLYLPSAQLGVAYSSTNNSWYPTGKFGDIHTTSTTLQKSVFGNDLSYRTLLRYIDASTPNKDSLYPAPSSTTNYWYYAPDTTLGDSSNRTIKPDPGLAIDGEGMNYYLTAGREVDVTMGYLSHPYAISTKNPLATPTTVGGGQTYYVVYGIQAGGNLGHSFETGGLRDNVTMLDVKSVRDDITQNNISMAVGYSLSFMFQDYNWVSRLESVTNTGLVYIRATGDGTENDTTGSLESGKGWSLGKETNVFHQFFGSDQYQSGYFQATTGWNTAYHRAYFNMSTSDSKAPQPNYVPNFDFEKDANEVDFWGNTNIGTNCHPMSQTQCKCVNWGNTWDSNLQAMWGTENGTLLSWFYNAQTPKSSKITSVVKEFENYIWADRYGKVVTDHYDSASRANGTETTDGFISVLKSVNDVCYGDGLWMAVGDWSGKNPANYCASSQAYTSAGTGTYINVRFADDDGKGHWKAVRISEEHCNITSVAFCNGWWYISGNKLNADGSIKEGVFFFTKDPTKDFSENNTTNPCWREVNNVSVYGSDGKITKNVSLSKINSMASQEG